jgi:hypothetical protein
VHNARQTDNHDIIATLPVRAVWTTNYDDLLERSFENVNKRVDVKRRQSDFAHHVRNADLTVYKMHGDKTDPSTAILTKEDYETYNKTRELFTIALKGDLVTKTFLILGFGFTDPNVGHIFGQVKQLLEGNARQHYCVLKKPRAGVNGDDENSCRRFDHRLADLKRYNLIPVVIEEYGEITTLLRELQRRSQLHDVFVSGSARGLDDKTKEKFDNLCHLLGAELIKADFNIISGFGRGVASNVMIGASEQLKRNDDQRLRMFPFPRQYELPKDVSSTRRKTQHRENILSRTGICVVLAGCHGDSADADGFSNGVREEVAIAKQKDQVIIPVGATGWVAREVWEQARQSPREFYGDIDVSGPLETLGNEAATPQEWVQAVIQIAKAVNR